MAKFTDNRGDDWLVDLTVFHVERIKRDVDVNLNDALVPAGDDGGNLITRLDCEPDLLVGVLYAACEDQVKQRGLGPEDFARRFAGEILNAAFAALVEALLAFFRKPNQRAALTAQLRMMHEGQRRVIERWAAAETGVFEKATTAMDAEIDQELEKLNRRFAPATSTASSTVPPASSASTQAR